jgi:hypothetical protein
MVIPNNIKETSPTASAIIWRRYSEIFLPELSGDGINGALFTLILTRIKI